MASRSRRSRCHGILQKEAHRDIERRAAPHFQAVKTWQAMRHEVCGGHQVEGPHARGEQRLVGVSKSCVCHQQALLRTRPFGELLGAEFIEQLPGPARRGGQVVRRHRHRAKCVRTRLACDFGIAVDNYFAEIVSSLVARSLRGGKRKSAGFSSRKEVVTRPA